MYGEENTTTGRPHLQCYVEFKHSVRASTLRRALPGLHYENRQGTPKVAAGYCKKGTDAPEIDVDPEFPEQQGVGWDHFFDHPSPTWRGAEFGEISVQGNRSDLNTLVQQVINSETTVLNILEHNPIAYHQYGRTLLALQDVVDNRTRRNWMTRGIWLAGPTGSGKTRYVWDNHPHDDIYVYNANDRGWWDTYQGQSVVLIDDFRGSLSFSDLLRMVDRYPYSVPRRGRQPTQFLARIVYITSPLLPHQVYHNLAQHDSLEQLYRRFRVEMMTPSVEELTELYESSEGGGGGA